MESTDSRSARVADVFHEVLEHDPRERAALLERACRGDKQLRADVESLLRADDEAGAFLQTSAVDRQTGKLSEADIRALVGQKLGRYELIDVESSGGMSTVYRAIVTGENYQQRVAVKVIRRGVMAGGADGRFDQERQVLAQLEHPYITRLVDGGTTADGVPYLVMEYVEGGPIDRYCDERALPVTERLALFRRACDAVHYAHQNLVIHRDIKPSNILVTGDGLPKLLDFGIAKLLDEAARAPAPDPTITLLRALTPRYASPEQVHGGPITTATDVYSLGVLLYELLTGHRPYDLDGKSTFEQGRIICEQDPPAPSAAVTRSDTFARTTHTKDAASIDAVSRARGERPLHLQRRLKGDLDNIILKALHKDPQRRYASIQQLSDDVGRYMAGLPVSARRDTLTYRAGKLIRRNKAVTAASVALLLALIVGVFGTSLGLLRAQRERNAAVEARNEAEAVAGFLQELLADANPYRSGEDPALLNKLLKDAESQIDKEYASHPATEAAVRYALANTYAGLWQWERAEPHLIRAVELRRRLHGDAHPALANALILLGRAYTFLRNPEAITVQREALAIRRRLHSEHSPEVAWSKTCLGFALWRSVPEPHAEEARRLGYEALKVQRRLQHERPVELAISLHTVAAMHTVLEEDEQAAALFGEAVKAYRALGDQQDRYRAECIRGYGQALLRTGRFEEAEPLLVEFLDLTPDTFRDIRSVRHVRWRLMTLAHHRTADLMAEQPARVFKQALDLAREVIAAECYYEAQQSAQDAERWEQWRTEIEAGSSPLPMIQAARGLIAAKTEDQYYFQVLGEHVVHLAALLRDAGCDRAEVTGLLEHVQELQEAQLDADDWRHLFTECVLASMPAERNGGSLPAASSGALYNALAGRIGAHKLAARACRRATELADR